MQQTAVMLIENLRMFLKSSVQRVACIDFGAKCLQCVAEGFLSGAIADDALTEQFKCLRQWNAGAHERRPLPRENTQGFGWHGLAFELLNRRSLPPGHCSREGSIKRHRCEPVLRTKR